MSDEDWATWESVRAVIDATVRNRATPGRSLMMRCTIRK